MDLEHPHSVVEGGMVEVRVRVSDLMMRYLYP